MSDRSNKTIAEFEQSLNSGQMWREQQVSLDIIRSAAAQAQTTVKDIEVTRGYAKEAAGQVGTETLSVHFQSYAASELRFARRLQFITAGILILVSAIAFAIVAHEQSEHASTWSTELVKLTVSIPMLALAYYLAREASGHMQASRSAREIEVRLSAIRAYTAELPEPDRLQIRAQLGRDIFTVRDWQPSSDAAKNSLGQESIDLANKLLDAAKAITDKAN